MARKKPTSKKRNKAAGKPKGTVSSKKATNKPWRWQKSFWRQHIGPAILLLVLPFALYFQCLQFGYILDDQIVITDNQFVKKGWDGMWDILTTESMTGYFGEQKELIEGGRYRPLSIMTFAAEYALTGMEYTDYEGDTVRAPNPFFAHLINILLYALCGLLLFRIFSALMPLKKQAVWLGVGFLTALLYILHPVHVEAVANVKGRDEILALLFSLVSLYAALRYRASGDRSAYAWLGGSCLAFFLGLLAKENTVTFLAVIPLTIYFFTRPKPKHIWVPVAAIGVTLLAYLALRISIVGSPISSKPVTDLMNNPFVDMTFGERIGSTLYFMLEYLRLLVFPHPLTHDYYPYHIPKTSWIAALPIISLIVHAALIWLAVVGFKKRKVPAYCFLFYFATISVFTNIVINLGAFMNERFLYMPSVAFSFLSAWFISRYLPQKTGKNISVWALALLAVLVIGYGLRTMTRVPVWKNAYTLNTAAVKVSKNSARANLFTATALYHKARKRDGLNSEEVGAVLDKAEYHINRALSIYPTYGTAMTMQAGIAAERYQQDQNVDKLLSIFYGIMKKKKQLNFIDEYLKYLANKGNVQQVATFCYEIGWEYYGIEKRDLQTALYHLVQNGLAVAPQDPRLLEAVARVYEAGGNAEKAQEYRRRIQN